MCAKSSLNEAPSFSKVSGTTIWLVGVARPWSISIAAVIGLKVEPGSNGLWKAREPRSAGALAETLFGSTVGVSATVRSLPVLTSCTTTIP